MCIKSESLARCRTAFACYEYFYGLFIGASCRSIYCYLLHPVRQLVRHRLSVVMYSVMNVFVCEVDVL